MVEICEYGEEFVNQREQVVYDTYSAARRVEALYIFGTAEKTDGAHNRQRKKDDNPLLMTVKNTKQWCMGQRDVVRKTKRAVSGESDER